MLKKSKGAFYSGQLNKWPGLFITSPLCPLSSQSIMHLNKQAIDEREWDEGKNGGWGKDRRWRAASIGLLGSFILAQLVKKTRQSALPSVTKAKLRLHKSSFTAHARDVCVSDNVRKTLVFLLSWITTRTAAGERMGEGEEGMRVMQRKIKEAAVTLQVSLEPCQQEWCGGMSGIGQTTKEKSEPRRNKDLRQSSLQYTACMRLLLCHTQNTPPA